MRESGHPFPGTVFSDVVSLGANCEPAHQLRLNGRYRGGLFDWLVTPLDSIAGILADDGAQLGTRFITAHQGTSVRCGVYDVLYHHEFPRGDGNLVLFDQGAIERCRSKMAHKWGRLVETCRDGGPILFIRFWAETDLPWDRLGPGKEPVRSGDLNGLAGAITRRFPDLDFRILTLLPTPGDRDVQSGPGMPVIGREFDAPLDPRVAIRAIRRGPEGVWAVTDGGWRDVLGGLAFRSEPASVGLGEILYWSGENNASGAPDVSDGSDPVPDVEPLLPRLIRREAEGGDLDGMVADLEVAITSGIEPALLAVDVGRQLWKRHRSFHAALAFDIAFRAGEREPSFLNDYLGLLSGETRYADVLTAAASIETPVEAVLSHVRMFSGHARLALSRDKAREIAAADQREQSAEWLSAAALIALIRRHLDERRPFSLIRLGDGEARFLVGADRGLCPQISDEEAAAIGEVVWHNWFGEPLAAVDRAELASLSAAYERAIREADVVGASGATRLRQDTGHFGYLALQEDWLRQVRPAREGRFWTSAFVHRDMQAVTPALGDLLQGLDVLGIISPHPGLADTLRSRFGIGRVIDHVIPAEGRLPTAAQTRAAGPHFPTLYGDLMARLSVPRPGCPFLVAGGLLGKVYCGRIKELGGIAIDIGAVVDAWMGYDTRPGQFLDLLPLGSAPSPAVSPAESGRTLACLSMPKTGSTAIASALVRAGFQDVHHLHRFGPESLAARRASTKEGPVARRLEDPTHAFHFVTCLRDPIARILSNAFHNAEAHRARTGVDLVRDAQSIIDWIDRRRFGEGSMAWFDDSFKATFGFDFRLHPFDHDRGSLRFASDRLRLLVLRQEDPRSVQEAELGWLVGRDRVAIRTENDSTARPFGEAYRAMCETFVAPPHWLDGFYETDLVRHFYTDAERGAFRERWSGRHSRVTLSRTPAEQSLSDAATTGPVGTTGGPAPALTHARTTGCLSIGKTSSMALAAALRDAGCEEAHHLHYLGPRALAMKRRDPEPMLDLATSIAGRIGDPAHSFRFVTCTRDPIARALSQAFYNAHRNRAEGGMAAVRDADSVVEWWEARFGRELSTEWFDDTFQATFGFDFREHPFDHERRSLRFASERLRLVVVRQEDPSRFKEPELGWLLDKPTVALPTVNDAAALDYAPAYRAFLETFVAPPSWLDTFYETEVARHFYTDEERAAFRSRWSGRTRVAPVARTEPPVGNAPPDQPASSPATAGGDAGHFALEAEITRLTAELETRKRREREGYAVDFNDFAYQPRTRDWSGCRGAKQLSVRFAADEEKYRRLLQSFSGHDARFRSIPVGPADRAPNWENWWLPGLDAVILYGLVAAFAPRVYLEIGSGHSTRFVRRAIDDNALSTRIISIDPNPTAEIDAICDEVVRARCEDLPTTLFEDLRSGDMLFVDNSHRSFQNSDATIFFTELLPELPAGVIYGLHDIFLPYDYPESWTNRFYNEQYLLMMYLLGGGGGDEIILPGHHVSRDPAFASLRDALFAGTRHLDWLTSSFWMRRSGSGPDLERGRVAPG